MATDLLLASANERVDLVDFEFLADSGFQANIRQPNAQFLTNPNGQRSWILDGFAISNTIGQQVQVAKGRAILGQREGALVHYGALTVEGDATKTIDMSTLTPNANYGLYVRFEYVDGDSGSRIFWNPAGSGSELAQTVATRRKANWSMRIELTNPGGEWLKIATLDNTGGAPIGITDERPLYFEGTVDSTYASGWSSEGGGSANDRNADRQQYGVKDFQTFTKAMRQGLEDLKGRGLRRWWDKGIGGMNVGFDDDPVEDRLAVGDADFNMYWDGTDSMLVFDASDDRIFYDRSANDYLFQIGGTTEMRLGTAGLRVLNGLIVGNTTGTPNDNEIYAEGNIQSGTGRFQVDADDYFDITNGGPQDWVIGGVTEMRLDTDGLRVENGLYVGSYSGTPTDNDIYAEGDIDAAGDLTVNTITMTGFTVDASGNITDVQDITGTGDLTMGSITMSGNIYTTGQIGRDSTDYIDWEGNDYMRFVTNNVEEMRLDADGLRIANGLYVGSNTGTATDNDIYAEGDIQAAGDVIAGSGMAVGHTTAPGNDEITVGDANFKMDWVSATDVRLQWDTDDYFKFTRNATLADKILDLYLGGVQVAQFRDRDTSVSAGYTSGAAGGFLHVGYIGDSPDSPYTTSAVYVGDQNNLAMYSYDSGSSHLSNIRFSQNSGSDVTRLWAYADRTDDWNAWTWHIGDSDTLALYLNTTILRLSYSGTPAMSMIIHARWDGTTPGTSNSHATLFTLNRTVSPYTCELYGMDDDGNVSLLTPHCPYTGEYTIKTYDAAKATTVTIWIERIAKALETLTGEKYYLEQPGDVVSGDAPPPFTY